MEASVSDVYVPLKMSTRNMAKVEFIYSGIYRQPYFHYRADDIGAILRTVANGAYRIHVEHGVPRDNLFRLLER